MDFDFVFIDGDHDGGIELDFELCKKCGTILFHDYSDRGQRKLNKVKNFIDTLPKNEITILEEPFVLWQI